MGVVRIDDELLKKLLKELEKPENKYKYPSISNFINLVVYEKLNKIKGQKKK